jgi:hypothetical protein
MIKYPGFNLQHHKKTEKNPILYTSSIYILTVCDTLKNKNKDTEAEIVRIRGGRRELWIWCQGGKKGWSSRRDWPQISGRRQEQAGGTVPWNCSKLGTRFLV